MNRGYAGASRGTHGSLEHVGVHKISNGSFPETQGWYAQEREPYTPRKHDPATCVMVGAVTDSGTDRRLRKILYGKQSTLRTKRLPPR